MGVYISGNIMVAIVCPNQGTDQKLQDLVSGLLEMTAVAWRTLNKANIGVLGDGEFTRLTANVHDLYVRGFYSFNFEGPHGGNGPREACWRLLENI